MWQGALLSVFKGFIDVWYPLYTFYYVLLCQTKLKELRICPKLGGFHFFFSRPQAGLTNQDHVRHYDTRVPLDRSLSRRDYIQWGDVHRSTYALLITQIQASNATLEYVTAYVLLSFLDMEQNCWLLVETHELSRTSYHHWRTHYHRETRAFPLYDLGSASILQTCVFFRKTTADIRTGSTFLT